MIAYAGGSLVLTAIYTALIVWVVGLAVPVTACYIICAVIAAPALIKLGVPDYRGAHVHLLLRGAVGGVAADRAVAVRRGGDHGGDPYKTTLQSWKYTLPAFLVPFVFVLDPLGVGLLLQVPKGGDWGSVALVLLETMAGIAVLACAFQGRILRRSSALETVMLTVGGMLLVFPELIGAILGLAKVGLAYPHLIGLALAVIVLLMQWMWRQPVQQGSRS